MSGLGIDFGHESEAYSTDAGSRFSAASTSTSGFHSRTRAHMIPKKSSMNKMRGVRPKTAEEDARRVRIVSGEPDVLGHGAYTDEDFMSPSSAGEEIIVQPHQLHSLSAAVAAMGGYQTDTATSSTETDTDQSPTLTESSVTSASSGASAAQKFSEKRKPAKKLPSNVQRNARSGIPTRPGHVVSQGRPVSEQLLTAGGRSVQKSASSTSLASGYRSDGASSLGRSAEIPRGVGRQRVSIRGAASRQGTLQARLGPRVDSTATQPSQHQPSRSSQHQEPVSDDETEVLVPDGFGGHARTKQPRAQVARRPATAGAAPSPSLLERIDMQSEPTRVDLQESRPTARWRVGSFYGPDGSETGRIDHKNNTISACTSQAAGSEVGPVAMQSALSSEQSSVSRSQTSSQAPKASHMRSPSNHVELQAQQTELKIHPDGSTKAAALEQNLRSRTSLASISMRSKRGLQGLEEAERGGALVSLDNYRMTYDTGLPILPHEITALDQDSIMGSVRLGDAQTMKTSLSQGVLPTSSSVSAHLSASPTKLSGTDAAKNGGKVKNRPRRSLSDTNLNKALLERNGTLLSSNANPLRRSKELDRLLGNSDRKLPSSAAKPMTNDAQIKAGLKRSNAVATSVAPPPAALEQGKANKARVEVDLVLESDLVVEGGTLQGRMQIRVRKGSDKEGRVFLAQPKIRVVGFEELLADDTRYIFYHHASVIDGDRSNNGPSEPYYLHGSPTLSSPETASFSALACFSGGPDAEGYAEGKIGSHSIPFSLELPVSKGAKGSYRGKNAVVRYIVIGSVKLKSSSGSNRSIAHFYRHVDLFPYLNPAVVLSSAVKPIQATSSKGLFLGGSGKVHLMASLHRNTWVAGQRVYINVGVQNDTSKKINGMTLSLIRTVTLYKPRPELNVSVAAARRELDPDACQTSTTRKKIAEEELEMGQKGSRGVVTARGWWTGVEAGQRVESTHYMQIPADALSISRGRHVEVVYSVKVSIGSSLSSDVSVELPIRVINFVSLDPPPLKKAGSSRFSVDATRKWSAPGSVFSDAKSPISTSGSPTGGDADPMVARLKSVDAMRSPGKTEISLQNYHQQQQAAKLLSPGEVAAEQNRRMQHQKSLDFINHAIRSAAARRGVDVTPTTSSSSARTPSPAGLGIGLGMLQSVSESESSNHQQSPGGSSSTDGNSGADSDQGDDTKTPLATARYTSRPQVFPPGCEPYEQHHHQVHQAQHAGTYSQLPVALHLPNGMHHMQQMQMQMYQMHMSNPAFCQRASPTSGGAMLPMLRINNANAVSLDDIGDDYDNDEDEAQQRANEMLALNDESMAEMNMVIGSARLEDEEFGQFDDSVCAGDVYEQDEDTHGLEQIKEHEVEGDAEGWSLRRRSSADDEEEKRGGHGRMDEDEVDDVAEVSSIMQTVSITPPVMQHEQGRMAPPPSSASGSSSTVSPVAADQSQPAVQVPTRGDSRMNAPAHVTRPLRINKDAMNPTTLLPQQVIRAKISTDHLPAQSSITPAQTSQALSSANLKRHSDNLSLRYQPQLAMHNRHRSTHSVSGLKPLLLQPKATSVGSSVGSRTPETPREAEFPNAGAETAEVEKPAPVPTQDRQVESPQKDPGMPRSSTLQSISSLTKPQTLRHSDSTSSLASNTTEPAGALSRSHSTHNLRGASIMVPSVRNKIAMLESRTATLREFTSTASASSSPAASPMKASTSSGRVSAMAGKVERGAGSGLTPGERVLGRKGSYVSMVESEDGQGSVVSSVMTVPDYMKGEGRGEGEDRFHAPVLRNLR
ncbi:Arrestin_C domain-containing protein [Pseudozyma hubeiensis]|nr:Arrestin_C domain-containing protein [Pseudozyma hubeiensis]